MYATGGYKLRVSVIKRIPRIEFRDLLLSVLREVLCDIQFKFS